MIDKDFYTSHIKDEETRLVIVKNLSYLKTVLKNHGEKNTDFLDPYQTHLFTSILNSFSDEISYRCCGGFDDSERKMVQIYPFYKDEGDIELPISAIEIKVASDDSTITHRDILGVLMSLGIVREKIGDIYIKESKMYAILDKNISRYVVMNLSKAKDQSVSVDVIKLEEIKKQEPKYEYKSISISSNRLDNIVAGAYNLSRDKASSLVVSKKVKVDFRPVERASEKVEGKSLISVKGRGRFVYFGDEVRISKKGRLHTKIGIYI